MRTRDASLKPGHNRTTFRTGTASQTFQTARFDFPSLFPIHQAHFYCKALPLSRRREKVEAFTIEERGREMEKFICSKQTTQRRLLHLNENYEY